MNCIICQTKLRGSQKKYCSQKCKNSWLNKGSDWYKHQRDKGLERKKELIKLKGGCCSKCGYNKTYGALTFHHIDPNLKEIKLDIRSLTNRSWSKILTEVEKCELVCFNCHMEIHYGENGGPDRI